MRTLASVGPARSISDQIRAIAGESPSKGVSPPARRGDRLGALALGDRLRARGAQRRGGADGGEQPLVRPGLGDEIGGAALHRLDRDADPGMGGDHHHHRLRIALQDLAEPAEALGGVGRAAAEIGVEQDDVGQLGVHRRERLVRVLEGGDLGEQVAQQQPRRKQDVGIVVDDDAAPEALRLIHRGALP